MHKSDRVMRQFRWMQQILPPWKHYTRWTGEGKTVHILRHRHLSYFTPYTDIEADACIIIDVEIDPVIDANVDARINIGVSKFCNNIHLHANSVTNTHHIIVLLKWVIDVTIFL
ncbi:hypothetical protein PVK06_038828 [Gossypium arboreum]|uniref:Uncharacterized protein n=1 Tax=Gossypium arboreum TaxID=29729 RepID=A0ABR0N351_GOSAR|nr:hypothetical protein PVK06_038828 [Gossypium arboreum]